MDLGPVLLCIREEMARRGMSVAELATLAGHPPAFSNPVSAASSISRMLSGDTARPSVQAVSQLCEALSIPFGLMPQFASGASEALDSPSATTGEGEARMYQRVSETPPTWRPFSIHDTPQELPTGEYIIIREFQRDRRYRVRTVGGAKTIVPVPPDPKDGGGVDSSG